MEKEYNYINNSPIHLPPKGRRFLGQELKRPTSFSQSNMFWQCPRSWFYKYILNLPRIEDLMFAHRGNVVHKTLEEYYPDKKISIEVLKTIFDDLWEHYDLDNTGLKNKKDESWLMVLEGVNLNLNITDTELEIKFDDVVGFIDIVDKNNLMIGDYKSSTRSKHNELEYTLQGKFYAYLWYRKYNKLIKDVNIYYLKYSGSKGLLTIKPTMQDIKNAEQWHIKTLQRMKFYIDNPKKLPPFNFDYNWSPYKHMWHGKDCLRFDLTLSGGYVYIKGDMDDFLLNHLTNKFSFEKPGSYYIKLKYPNANTTVYYWDVKLNRLPIGFLEQVKKTLSDYCAWKNKKPFIIVNDTRSFDSTVIDMPNKLLSDKTLRPYQQKAVDTYLNKYKISILEISTGGGKSLVLTEIIRRLGYKTLFLIDKKDLMYQFKETVETELGLDVGIIGDGIKTVKDITVATVQTIVITLDPESRIEKYLRRIKENNWLKHADEHNIYPRHFELHVDDRTDLQQQEFEQDEIKINKLKKLYIKDYKLTKVERSDLNVKSEQYYYEFNELCDYLSTIRFVCFDECQKVNANSYYTISHYLKNTQYRLGVSATARRQDGNDMTITAVTGDIIFSLTGQSLIDDGYLVKPNIYFINGVNDIIQKNSYERLALKGLMNETPKYSPFYESCIQNNNERNNCIVTLTNNLVKQQKQVLILVKLIEHGKILQKLITDSFYLHGCTNDKDRKNIIKNFKDGSLRVLISTISIFAEGVDVPKLDAVINASANKGDIKTIQILGRILRKSEGKDNACYYDFFDSFKFFTMAALQRIKTFRKEGYYVKQVNMIDL